MTPRNGHQRGSDGGRQLLGSAHLDGRDAVRGGPRHEDESVGGAFAYVTHLAEVVAVRVVEALDERERRQPSGLATAAELAEQLGVAKSWVYANQERLGAIRLGQGPKARLRFDVEQAARAIQAKPGARPQTPRRPGRPRKTPRLPPGVELLRGRQAPRRS
jgi:hypothetical protein